MTCLTHVLVRSSCPQSGGRGAHPGAQTGAGQAGRERRTALGGEIWYDVQCRRWQRVAENPKEWIEREMVFLTFLGFEVSSTGLPRPLCPITGHSSLPLTALTSTVWVFWARTVAPCAPASMSAFGQQEKRKGRRGEASALYLGAPMSPRGGCASPWSGGGAYLLAIPGSADT